jgi:hypothetical protein
LYTNNYAVWVEARFMLTINLIDMYIIIDIKVLAAAAVVVLVAR